MNYYAGLDWGESHHDMAVVDADGQLISHTRVTDDASGLTQLLAALTAVKRSRRSIPVGIETSRGLMVAGLRKAGQPVVVLNPTQVANYRSRLAPQRKNQTGVTPAYSRTFCASTAAPTAPHRRPHRKPAPCEKRPARTDRRRTPPVCSPADSGQSYATTTQLRRPPGRTYPAG